MKRILTVGVITLVLLAHGGQAFAANVTLTDQATTAFASIIEKLKIIVADLTSKIALEPGTQVAAVTAPGTGVGNRAQTNALVNVYDSASINATVNGTQPVNAIGTITAGPIYEYALVYPKGCEQYSAAIACTGSYASIYWVYVNFDTGMDGWVKRSSLKAAASAKFTIDSRVVVKADTNVRSTPYGTVVGSQPATESGIITGAPVTSGGYVWWPVNYDNGVDGWTTESNILNPGIELSLLPPVLLNVPESAFKDRAVMDALASSLDVPVNSLIDTLTPTGGRTYAEEGGHVVMVIPIARDASALSGFTQPKQREVIIVSKVDPVTGEVETKVIEKNGQELSIKVNTSDDNGTVSIAIQDAAGKITQLVAQLVETEERDVKIVISRLNENGELEVLEVQNIDDNLVETLIKNLPWPTLPTDEPEFPEPKDDTVTHGVTVVQGTNGNIYVEGSAGKKEYPGNETSPNDDHTENFKCSDYDCGMDTQSYYDYNAYLAEISYDAFSQQIDPSYWTDSYEILDDWND